MTTNQMPGLAGIALALHLTATPAPASEQLDDENAAYLPEFAAECQRLGLPYKLTRDPGLDLPEVREIDGVRTIVARADEIGVAYDELRYIGRCLDCRSDLDDTAVTVDSIAIAGTYTHITGEPAMICLPCRTKREALAADPAQQAFTRAVNAIEAALQVSGNPERTRNALRYAVDAFAGGTQ